MAPRALGALLALAAAIAFVVSIASSAWWAGPPTIEGDTIEAKDVRVGLLGATGCNAGGDGTCETLETGLADMFYIELGAIGLAVLVAFVLTISAFTVGDRRKGLAKLNIFTTLLAAAGGGALLYLGPDIQASQAVTVPIGWGSYVFGGAVASSLLASLIAHTIEPEPLRLKTGIAPATPVPSVFSPPPEPVNPRLTPDPVIAPRTAIGIVAQTGKEPGSNPMATPLGRSMGLGGAGGSPVDPLARTAPPEGRGEPPPMAPPRARGPSGVPPLGDRPKSPSAPPFGERASAPNMSPDRTKAPSASPPLGDRSSAPNMSLDRTKAPSAPPFGERPSAPNMSPDRTKAPSASPPLGDRSSAPNMSPDRTKAPSASPPLGDRTKSPSALPPMGDRTKSPSALPPLGDRTKSPSTAPPGATAKPPSRPSPSPRTSTPVPMPARPSVPAPARAKPGSNAPAPSSTAHRADADPVAPPPRLRRARTTPGPGTDPTVKPLPPSEPREPELRPSGPTLAHAVPPMPAPDNLPAPAVLPARDLTAVEIDAEATAHAEIESTARGTGLDPRIAARVPRIGTEVRTGKQAVVGDVTSVSLHAGVNLGDADGSENTGDAIPRPRSVHTGVDILAAPRVTDTHVGAQPDDDEPVEAPRMANLGLGKDPRMTATHIGAVPEPRETGRLVAALPDHAVTHSGEVVDPPTQIGAVPVSGGMLDSGSMLDPASMLDSGALDADTGVSIAAAPSASKNSPKIITGEERALSTMQRHVARAPTEDPFESGRAGSIVPPDGPVSEELASPRSAELGAVDAPVTEVHAIPSASELADELSRQSASGSIGDSTDMKRTSDLLSAQRPSEETPIPTFHGRPPGPRSTAPSSLPPPRTVETAPSGPRPACPQCESPMAWVEEHLRFYCKQCRMYF